MSHYANYIKEIKGDGIVEREEGFATYRYINNKKSVYIIDIYVDPKFRRSNVMTKMADEICEIAKKEGATEVFGSVVPSSFGSTLSLKAILGYGLQLHSCTNDAIILRKEI